MMKRFTTAVVSLAALGIVLGGCDSTKEVLGVGKKRAPDEFSVYTRAPLSMPPDFGLRPPEPGADRPTSNLPRDEARTALLATGGRKAEPARPDLTRGTRSMLKQMGALDIDPAIRDEINKETSLLAETDKSLTEKLMFWGTPTQYGTVVDPAKESRRLQEKMSLGREVTEGETPTISRKRRALFEGLFD